MKNMLFFFILILTTIGFAQNDETFVKALVAQKIAELEMQECPEYFFRKEYCEGNIQSFIMPGGEYCTSTSTYYSVYVFWKEGEDKLNVQKFDNCGSFKPYTIVISKNIAKALKDKKGLKAEKIKPYMPDEKEVNAADTLAQSCFKEYKFFLEGLVFEKTFKEEDFTKNSDNKSLALFKLDEDISEMINYFEMNGKLFREN